MQNSTGNLKKESERINDADIPEKTYSKWSKEDQEIFSDRCADEAEKKGMDIFGAAFYCDCMQEKMEERYPDPADAEKLTESDMKSPEIQQLIKYCRQDGEK